MTGDGGAPRTLADVMSRRRVFVGRVAELELLASALAADEPPFHVLYVHGPGGVGKTSLLLELERVATAAGRTAVRVDARDGSPSADGVLDSLAAALGVPARALDSFPERAVLFVDTYELWSDVDAWVRRELIPSLPASTVVVVAGRQPPGGGWRSDLALWEMTRSVALRNLDPDEGRELVARTVSDEGLREEIVGLACGHPLALALLADTVAHGGDVGGELWTPELVEEILRRFIDVTPSAVHRRGLEALAMLRVTTEEELRAVIGDRAAEVFAWLRGLSFVESGPEGLFPHDLARNALEADLRWRDPAGFRELLGDLRAQLYRRFFSTSGRDRQRALVDGQYWFRRVPVLAERIDWSSFGLLAPVRAAARQDHPAVLDLCERWGGVECRARTARWLQAQPEALLAVRDADDRLRGAILIVDLARAEPADIAADPVAAAAWEHVRSTSPAQPGETVLLMREVLDAAKGYDAPSGTSNLLRPIATQRLIDAPDPFWMWCLHRPVDWEEAMTFYGIPRLPVDLPQEAGDELGLFGVDHREVPFGPWFEEFGKRVLEVATGGTPTAATSLLALSRADFAAAVKQALVDLHRPEALARNPLTGSRLAGAAGDPATALREAVLAAVRQLDADARSRKFYRALDRTYLRPATTQERAAQVLDLPFSTYRRHLTEGIARVVDILWRQDLLATGQHERN